MKALKAPGQKLWIIALCICLTVIVGGLSVAAEKIMHPMMNPKMYSQTMLCPNCGMMINMWARTRHQFTNSEGTHETCSIRCMSDLSMKAGEAPENVQVALYTNPDRMVSAENAVYVVGSSAPGTMTMKSKLAFETKEDAEAFMKENGGEIANLDKAIKMATMELDPMRDKLQMKRAKGGKLELPTAQTACTVCGMYPERYPGNRAQITTASGKHLHFCSNKCMLRYRENPAQFIENPEKEKAVWASVYPQGGYDYANGLYYVVGSKMNGPMGKEAFAFREKQHAQAFATTEGGQVVKFSDLSLNSL